jgi:hypothetical protein
VHFLFGLIFKYQATTEQGHRSQGPTDTARPRLAYSDEQGVGVLWVVFQKKPIFMVGSFRSVAGVTMDIDHSRLIAQFQRLITEMLVEKRLGQRRPELTDELYQTWREVEHRGLKESPEYREVLLRADRHALWLVGLVRLDAASSV